MGLDPAFWAGRHAFVTGHTGFKGAWLTLFLHYLGMRVSGYALDPISGPNLFEQSDVGKICNDRRGDIRNLDALKGAMSAAAPDIVFHLAAQSLVRESYRAPLETFATNVMGTAHVLEAARGEPSIKAMVVITSDKCYRNDETAAFFSENDALGGEDPYSASKACAEILTHAYRTSFTGDAAQNPLPPVATARAGNVIGGGDWSVDRLVPDCIRAFADGKPVTLRQPQSVRPWQHVLESAYGYLLLAQRLAASGGGIPAEWNFGPPAESHAPVAHVAAVMARHFGGKVVHEAADPAMKEAHILKLDSRRAQTALGWRPVWSLETALEETARWYQAAATGESMQAFSLRQIEAFHRAAIASDTP